MKDRYFSEFSLSSMQFRPLSVKFKDAPRGNRLPNTPVDSRSSRAKIYSQNLIV